MGSKRVIQRKLCPSGSYRINARTVPELEQAMVHMLRLHSTTIHPKKFLTRCVVCNGTIVAVTDEKEKPLIFLRHGSPDLSDKLDCWKCDSCDQGYRLSDTPGSSSSRAF